MNKITLDNRDLEHVHIDTYQMLTGDNFTESEIENQCEELNNDKLTYDDFEWEYDHKQIVEDFAKASIDIVNNGIQGENGADCITAIEYVSSTSPQFYNYTTDSYIMTVTVDAEKINKYIDANHAAIVAIAGKYDATIIDNYIISSENMQHAAVCHIINNAITSDDYNMAMWELENEIYSENTTVTLIPTMPKQEPKTKDAARQYAIDWQNWQAEKSLSYSDCQEWTAHFETIAEQFDLVDEFKENGII